MYNGVITKFTWGDLRAQPPQLSGHAGDRSHRPHESALMRRAAATKTAAAAVASTATAKLNRFIIH